MINHIIYRVCKYEDGHTSLMAWTADNEDGFKSADEALDSLAAWLLEKYKLDTGRRSRPTRKCCKQSKENEHLANYCMHCGYALQDDHPVNEEELERWIASLSGTTCDTFGEWSEVAVADGACWTPWVFPPGATSYWKCPSKKEVVTISEDGEVALAKRMTKLAVCEEKNA